MNKYTRHDIIRRLNFLKSEKKTKVIKYLSCSVLYNNLRKKIFYSLYMLQKSSISSIQNRCIVTGRSKGIFRDFRLSRIVLKNSINNSEVPTVRKFNR